MQTFPSDEAGAMGWGSLPRVQGAFYEYIYGARERLFVVLVSKVVLQDGKLTAAAQQARRTSGP